ncbi:SMP-30/gluconolactonase/LRE family protein [Streptomyces sp. NPDC058683]|uniref:SMP-30/gluconolactonase/LRE family protein n=1 Tax=Streptomyces sp. NPDC058683 TaxID=3346597 RepID=UPI00364E1C76
MITKALPIKKRSGFAAISAVAAVIVSAPYASAATECADAQPAVSHVRTVAAFDFATGDVPENVTVAPDNSLTVSMVGAPAGERPALVRISPSGQRTVLVTGQKGDGITGNTRGHDGTIYYNVWSSDASRNGVWKLAPGGTPHRISALPVGGVPNGLAIDPAGRTLYVADSQKGTVWAVPVSGGPVTAWLVDPALAIKASAPVPYGANGLRFHNGAVWVSNLSKGTLLRIPVTATGAPGRIHTVTSSLTGVDDFNFLSAHSNVVFAALNTQNQIAVVYPDGTTRTVLTASDGLASPTATAVRGQRLYITDGGLNEPHDAKLQTGTIDLGALLSH